MNEKYILVTDPTDNEPVEILLSKDGTCSLTTLEHAFPRAYGLKYKNPSTEAKRVVSLDESGKHFIEPADGWEDKTFEIIFKHDEQISSKHKAENNSRPFTPSPSPPIGEPYPYDLAEKFMFYIPETQNGLILSKSCVVAINPRYFVTFRHGSHLSYEKETTQLTIYHSSDESRERAHIVTVVDINKQFDFVLLKSDNDVIQNAPPFSTAKIGEEIRVVGYGNHHQKLGNMTGQIHLGKIQCFHGAEISMMGPFFLGTAPTWPGDSGASCWNWQGLVGINVSMMKMPTEWHRHTEIFDNAALYYGRNCISAIDAIIDSMENHKAIVEFEAQKERKRNLEALLSPPSVLPLPDHMKPPSQLWKSF